MNTNQQYSSAVESSKSIFLQKTKDYGTSWRVYRTISVADQIYIKAKRIRTIQENGVQKIDDDIISEFKGILNYGIIGLIQLDINDDELEDLPYETVEQLYNEKAAIAQQLMQDKNHDYGEAWREMSQESFVDLILAKILRIKQILVNRGKTIISEGIDANYFDIINYAAFALILIDEEVHSA
jgi:membrane-associated HD superfamily phosphohydrolase